MAVYVDQCDRQQDGQADDETDTRQTDVHVATALVLQRIAHAEPQLEQIQRQQAAEPGHYRRTVEAC